MNIYQFFLFSITITQIIQFTYGQNTAVDGECNPVNTLLGKAQSYNCCLDINVNCQDGHITFM